MKLWKWIFILSIFIYVKGFGQSGNLYIKIEQENIRSEPNGPKIGEALAGTKVEILEKRPNWIKVQLTGWIWENSLTSDPTKIDGYTIRASDIVLNTKEEADSILNLLKRGTNFEELAKTNSVHKVSGSKGGDIGRFGRGDLVPEIDDVVFSLKVGQISEVIQTSKGYHIFKRTE